MKPEGFGRKNWNVIKDPSSGPKFGLGEHLWSLGGGVPPISEVEFYACLERPQEILYGQIKGGETETGRVGGFMTLPNVRTFRTHVRLQHSNYN